jgi:hypothetical protein
VKHKPPLAVMLVLALALTLLAVGPASGQSADPTLARRPPDDVTDPPPLFTFDQYPPSVNDNVVLQWDEELLQAVRALPPGPTVTARAISVVHTVIFDAWAAYDAKARGTRLGASLRRPAAERTVANKNKAISFAAYKALVDLFPARKFDFDEQMAALFGPDWAADTSTPVMTGTTAAQAVLDYRHADGANQLNGYADTCRPACYQPVNTGDTVVDPWRWQPLRVPLGVGPQQRATTPHWSKVKGFALSSPSQFQAPGPDRQGNAFDPRHVDNLLALTSGPNGSGLTDQQKVTAEYWADGPRSEFPPGHWALIAQVLSRKRGHSLDYDARMFFALGNALMDASIAAWAAKFRWDFVRPITAIRERYKGRQVTSWLGPYQGYGQVQGEQWIPYQSPNVVTPPFPEYVSGHSTFSSAAAAILARFTGSDAFGAGVTVKAGSSLFEPRTDTQAGTPATDILLTWPTLTAAAKNAGLSRRLGGIHFQDGDEHGYNLGQRVGTNVLARTLAYVNGTSPGTPPG